MPRITISHAANEALRQISPNGALDHTTSRPVPQGIEISIDPEVLARLDALRLPGESYSTAIMTLCANLGKRPN